MKDKSDSYCVIIQDNSQGDEAEPSDHDGASPVKRRKGQRVWSNSWIKAFIALRTEMDDDFAVPSRRRKAWKVLHQRMKEEVPGFTSSLRDTQDKWKNLLVTYRKNKEMEARGEAAFMSWEWFKPMDALLSEKDCSEPDEEDMEEDMEGSEDEEDGAPGLSSPSRGRAQGSGAGLRSPTRKTPANPTTTWLQNYFSRRLEREEEMAERDERVVQLMENLVSMQEQLVRYIVSKK